MADQTILTRHSQGKGRDATGDYRKTAHLRLP